MAQLTAKIEPTPRWPDDEQARVFLWLAEQQQNTVQAIRSLLHRIQELEAELAKPRSPAAAITKAQIEDAAASLFITDGGGEGSMVVILDRDGLRIGALETPRMLPDVVALLCHHLGVKE